MNIPTPEAGFHLGAEIDAIHYFFNRYALDAATGNFSSPSIPIRDVLKLLAEQNISKKAIQCLAHLAPDSTNGHMP